MARMALEPIAAGVEPTCSARRRRRLLVLVAAVLLAVGGSLGAIADGPAAQPTSAPVLSGYAPDRACAGCHADLAASYSAVGMAQSFARPAAARAIESFDQPFLHAPSGRLYSMAREGDTYIFRRHLLDSNGQPVFEIELTVAWILGSGHTSRTYLYAAPSGELFQLPIAWYSQEQRWGMAPGYDQRDHPELSRRVRRECMFCHNAYPEAAPGADSYGTPPFFADELPQGTGCQRCHGPGADHIELAASGFVRSAIMAIVNPRDLPAERARDVCYQCHLQPSVALFGARVFGRSDYSFRPGQSLAEYRVLMDVDQESRARAERFEINHHPYRLEQSACFRESAGALTCTTCHDPHRKVPAAERAQHYRVACQSCHRDEPCTRPEHQAATADDTAADCVACHMPRRRTQDVVHVTMTDHFIRRQPPTADLLAPLAEYEPILLGVELTDGERSPAGDLGEIYKAATVARLGGGVSVPAVERLAELLARHPTPEVEPYLDLALGQLTHGRWSAAAATLELALARAPDRPQLLLWSAIAENGRGHTGRAIELARQAIAAEPRLPEAQLNLGLFLRDALRPEEAVAAFARATELRPTFAAAWYHLGQTREALGQTAAAVAAQRRALSVDPAFSEAYAALVRLLRGAGEAVEAETYLELGLTNARDPALLASSRP
jgi:Tfp pilus assembly protein PilF